MKSMLIKIALAWLGIKEGTPGHRDILGVYNSQRPLPRGYKVKETDAWCATFVSACFIKAGIDAPRECSCQKLFNEYKAKGMTVQRGLVEPGDVVFYTWDGGKTTHHVGICTEVFANGLMVVVEGNKDDKVGERRVYYDSSIIYGIGRPKYEPEEIEGFTFYTVKKGDSLSRIAKAYGCTLTEIIRYNTNIKNPNLIHPGDVIKIPKKGV